MAVSANSTPTQGISSEFPSSTPRLTRRAALIGAVASTAVLAAPAVSAAAAADACGRTATVGKIGPIVVTVDRDEMVELLDQMTDEQVREMRQVAAALKVMSDPTTRRWVLTSYAAAGGVVVVQGGADV